MNEAQRSEDPLDRFVMCRDASFWNKPDTIKPKKYHLISDKTDEQGFHIAKCDKHIRLLDDSKAKAESIKFLLCKKCFRDT